MQNILHEYTNGGFSVQIYKDGTKIREQIGSVPAVMPEQMDLKITNWCDAGCGWCHENSTTAGKHADLNKTLDLLKVLQPGTEVAIGGGDPLSHPDFSYFVKELRKIGIVPSVTVNGRHLQRSMAILQALTKSEDLFGVGVSYFNEVPDWDYPNLVLHLITGINPPTVLEGHSNKKVLLLGYKDFGRGQKMLQIQPEFVRNNMSLWYRLLPWVAKEHHLSFDNLAIEQLNPRRIFANSAAYSERYMGPEGQFSMYIDAVEQEFALCSYAKERHSWSNMKDMFRTIQRSQGFIV